jgi:aquaporin Z
VFRPRIVAAELIGTLILVLGGPGTAVLTTNFGPEIGTLGIALGFGFALLVAAYAIGPISGCHINPAVTLGLWLHHKVESSAVPSYVLGQVAGALIGGAALVSIAGSNGDFDVRDTNFATNGWGDLSPGGFDFAAMAFTEILLTAVLVFVVLSTTHRDFTVGQGGITVGLTLALIHFISIPVDNTSVNPVRSLATNLFAGGDALDQLWAFIVFPLGGAVLGWAAWRVCSGTEAAGEPLATDVPAGT